MDAAELITRNGGRFFRDSVVAIDAGEKEVTLKSGKVLSYNLLSLNVGSEVPTSTIDGADRFGWTVKPIENLTRLGESILRRAESGGTLRLVVAGGGAAGCEVPVAPARKTRQAARDFGLSGHDPLRFGPAFTWQWMQVRLHNLPTFNCRTRGRVRRRFSPCCSRVVSNRFISQQNITYPSSCEIVRRNSAGFMPARGAIYPARLVRSRSFIGRRREYPAAWHVRQPRMGTGARDCGNP